MPEINDRNFNKLKWLEQFRGEIEQVSMRLECSGDNTSQELQKLYCLLLDRVFVLELSEFGSDIKNLSHKTFYAMHGQDEKDSVCEAVTKLLMHIEEVTQKEKENIKMAERKAQMKVALKEPYQRFLEIVAGKVRSECGENCEDIIEILMEKPYNQFLDSVVSIMQAIK